MASRTVRADEFLHWLTPAQALDRLKDIPTIPARQGWIAWRLRDRLLRAAAEMVVQPDYGDRHFILLAGSDWSKWAYESDHHFWDTGDYGGIAISPMTDVTAPFRAYNVRFDPAPFDQRDEERGERNAVGWNRLAEGLTPMLNFWEQQLAKGQIPDVAEVIAADREEHVGVAPSASAFEVRQPPEVEKPRASSGKPPKVTQKELLNWYKGQFAENPNSPFSQIKARAEAHFHPRPVTRRPLQNVIAQMGHGLSPGNPLIRRK